MKKMIIIIIAFVSISVYSQTDKTVKHEIKLNVGYALGGIPELSYEYLLNDESAFGISLLYAFDDDNDLKFALTPYYRMYFGNKKAAGFFAEAFGMYNVSENNELIYYDYIPYPGAENNYIIPTNNESDFALGVAIGAKFLTKKDFIFEFYGGLGRNLLNNETMDAVPRLGISFGKRF
jgi:hypothetical protein